MLNSSLQHMIYDGLSELHVNPDYSFIWFPPQTSETNPKCETTKDAEFTLVKLEFLMSWISWCIQPPMAWPNRWRRRNSSRWRRSWRRPMGSWRTPPGGASWRPLATVSLVRGFLSWAISVEIGCWILNTISCYMILYEIEIISHNIILYIVVIYYSMLCFIRLYYADWGCMIVIWYCWMWRAVLGLIVGKKMHVHGYS